MNTKVKRLLSALAVVMKDESPALIEEVHKVINDERDGYNFDFKAEVDYFKSFIEGGYNDRG